MALTTAQHQKNHRERMKAAGLVKAELWITPENKATLKQVEGVMRDHTITVFDTCEFKQSLEIEIIRSDEK